MIKKIRVEGLIGLKIGLGKEIIELDLSKKFPGGGIVAILGKMGTGKSSFLDSLHPYRRSFLRGSPTSKKAFDFKDSVGDNGGSKQVVMDIDGETYTFGIKQGKNRAVCFINKQNEEDPKKPISIIDKAQISNYTKKVNEILGDEDIFRRTYFRGGVSSYISTLERKEQMKHFFSIVGLSNYESKKKAALQVLKTQKDKCIVVKTKVEETELLLQNKDLEKTRKELKKLEKAIQTISDEIKELEKKHSELNEHLKDKERINQEINNLQEIKHEKEKEIKDFQNGIKNKEKEIKEYTERIKTIEKDIEEEKQEKKSISIELENLGNLTNDRNTILTKYQAVKEKKTELDTTRVILHLKEKELRDIERLKQDEKNILSNKKILEDTIIKSEDFELNSIDINEFINNQEYRNIIVAKFETRIASVLEEKQKQAIDSLILFNKELEQTQTEIKEKKEEELIIKEINDLNKKINDLQEELKKDAEIEEQMQGLNKLLTDIGKLSGNILSLNDSIQQKEKKLTNYLVQLNTHSIDKKNFEFNKEEKSKQIISIDEKIEELKKQKDKEIEDIEYLPEINKKKDEQYNLFSQKGKYENDASFIEDKEKELIELKKEYQTLLDKRELIELFTEAYDPKAGIPMFCFEEKAPEIEQNVNLMLDGIMEGFIEFKYDKERKKPLKDGNEPDPELSIIYHRKSGRSTVLENLSGGEKQLIESALALGSIVYNQTHSPKKISAMFLDECDNSIDDESLTKYYEMIRKAHKLANCEQTFFITHRKDKLLSDFYKMTFDSSYKNGYIIE